MALSIDYVARETATNLRRNLLMTGAAILTVAISLTLVGGALLLKQGVSDATIQWQGGVELSVFMQPGASAGQDAAVEAQLASMQRSGLVKSFRYLNQQQAYAEFRTMFASEPDMLNTVSPGDLPASYRIVPAQASDADQIGSRFNGLPGVKQVVYAKQTVDTLLKVTHILQLVIVVIAGILLLSALVLILNTIRMAIFSRRREVAVMKLVGATNWFIRVPFMLEGLIQGMVGAAVAFALVFLGRGFIAGEINHYNIQLFRQLVVSPADAIGTGIFVLVVGALVGAVGSAVAVRRFLDV
ncbi:MAG TPA: permease-like cell division protein FtsX [Acidimicrobiales bacterium]|nr:permease-like cell division protein FtsX [Acidimicrobiales bacterium]